MTRAIIDWAVLAVSFFNTISLLWLGWMVLLSGNRRSAGAWLTGGGLLLGALFFTSHTAILGRGLGSASMGMNFWWILSWMPAVAAPLAWYSALLWYAGFRIRQPHPHRGWLLLVCSLSGLIALLLAVANPLPTYQHVTGTMLLTPSIGRIPLLVLVYVGYSLLCYLLPLDLLRRVRGTNALETRSRLLARPWLAATSIALLMAGIVLAWTAFWAVTTRPVPILADPSAEQTVKILDLTIAGLVALAITLLGRAIVRYEVFTGKPLPRDRFLRQWRSTVVLAAGFGVVAGWTLSIGLHPVYSLMLATALMTLFYALYSWSAHAEREAFMERLRPFIASQDLYGQVTAPSFTETGQNNPSQQATDLFQTLCQDVLAVQQAALVPAGTLASLAGPPLVFPTGSQMNLPRYDPPAGLFRHQERCITGVQAGIGASADWAVPLWSSRGLDGVLYIKEKHNRNPLSEEEIEIAQTAGERLLDLLAGAEMARLAIDLLGQRLAQARAVDWQGRRVLHDEVLPELHSALLYLSEDPSDHIEKKMAMESLAQAHRRLASLMRELPVPQPQHLAQNGLGAALKSLVENDLAGQFSNAVVDIQPEAAEKANTMPLYVCESLFFAARELVRNAAEHGRGDQADRDLSLLLRMGIDKGFYLSIEDDGVGYQPAPGCMEGNTPGPKKGGGSGLRIHNALLAAVGASLEITARPGGGTQAVIRVRGA